MEKLFAYTSLLFAGDVCHRTELAICWSSHTSLDLLHLPFVFCGHTSAQSSGLAAQGLPRKPRATSSLVLFLVCVFLLHAFVDVAGCGF